MTVPGAGASGATERAIAIPVVIHTAAPPLRLQGSRGSVLGLDWGGGTVACGLLLFVAVWLVLVGGVSLSPPVDDIEQLIWVESLSWGYYKHPPLPTWLIWLPVQVFGRHAWVAYGLGALLTAGSLGLFWRLLVELRGRTHAAVGLLAAASITFYTERIHYYNHNIVLLALVTASAWLTWQAVQDGRLRWWLGLGVALGLGALTKYQIALTVVSALVFIGRQGVWRQPQQRLGLWLAALVALLIFTPHLVWLRQNDYAPVEYATQTSLGLHLAAETRLSRVALWLADQWLNRGLPALILLWLAGRSARSLTGAARRPPDAARTLLLAWGLLPFLCMVLLGLWTGADLQLHWGTAFLLFTVSAAMELTRGVAWSRVDGRTLLWTFALLQGLLLTENLLTSPYGPARLRERHWRSLDSRAIADTVAEPARVALGGPIRVVIGPPGLAGALALRLPERPQVLIDGRHDRSPWVSEDRLRRCGAIEIGPHDDRPGGHHLPPPNASLMWHVVEPIAGAGPCQP